MEIQILKIIVCIIFSMFFGYLWYSPAIFAGTWAKEVGMPMPTKEKCCMPKKQLFFTFLQTFITITALNLLLQKTQYQQSLYQTLCTESLLGVGITSTTIANGPIWRRDSLKFFSITSIHSILSLLLCATIMYYM